MLSKSENKYLLAIKRENNDFLPLEWHYTSFYDGEDLKSLEGIDQFTKKMTKIDLLLEVVNLNMMGLEDRYRDFTIIYKKNNKYYELKDGCIFLEDVPKCNDDALITFIIQNVDNKEILNHIYNLCYAKDEEPKLKEFRFILNNIQVFLMKGDLALRIALNTFKEISYPLRRSLLIRIYKKVINSIDLNKNSLIKKEPKDDVGIVA